MPKTHHYSPKNISLLTTVAITVACIGTVLLITSHAATGFASLEAEKSLVSSPIAIVSDPTASNSGAIAFGQGSSSPSDASMPVGNITGWKQIFTDDFTASSLSNNWEKYTGNIASMPGGVWAADRVAVKNGLLVLSGANRGDGTWTTGAVSLTGNNNPAKRTYGKYLIRMRIDKANGVKYAGLLWAYGNRTNTDGTVRHASWPRDGEIDFIEDGGGARTGTTATTHYADASGNGHYIVQRPTKVDTSQWHTYSVEWTPTKLSYAVDGVTWGEVTSPAAAIPQGNMFFALQLEANTRGATQYMTTVDATTPAVVNCDVDWVSIYAPN